MAQSAEVPQVAAPPIPTKWEIIPIHASDVSNFLRCRRYWSWSSPSRLNLRRRVDLSGVYFPLWYGSGIHYALEMMYHPFMPRDPVEAWTTWYDYQWNGGVVTEEWLDRTYDNDPQELPAEDKLTSTDADGNVVWEGHPPKLYRIRGIKELHPDPIHEEFEMHRDLGIGMMTYYRDYAKTHDEFVVVAAEAMFSVPLGFEAIDPREDSPNYGKKIEVHARGKRDSIIYSPRTERFALLENKTASSMEDEYFTKLELDPQVTTYMWASQEEAKIHDLPYKRIDGTLYNVLLKKYPKPPTILKDGVSPSLNRKDECTTAELFAAYIAEAGIKEIYDNDPKMQGYYNYLVNLGDRQFVERRQVLRNPHHLKSQGQHLRAIAEEMLNPNVAIYPTPSGSWYCTKCQFRIPCIAAEDGSDYVHILSDAYETNKGR